MTDELKPCPFCGGEAVYTYYNGGWPESCDSVQCGDWKCPSRSGGRSSKAAAAELWNTRADAPAQNVRVKPLEWDGSKYSAQYCAQSILGEIVVTAFGGKWFHRGVCYGDDLEAAKAAAYAHKCAAIRAELEPADPLDDPRVKQALDGLGYECVGCGHLCGDPEKDLALLKKAGAISCCPERKMRALSESLAAALAALEYK